MKAMKTILALTTLTLTASLNAFAGHAQQEICGKTTRGYSEYNWSDLEEKLGWTEIAGTNPEKELLTKTEVYMLRQTYFGEDVPGNKEFLKEFISVDGHIDYLQQTEGGEMIAIVMGYPGDTPVGAIFTITEHESGKKFATRFATIGDGDIMCDGAKK